jgi:capsular exopolysaccharide synthesis family protein
VGSSTTVPTLASVQVVQSPPAPPRSSRRHWPTVGGLVGLAAGVGLGLAYHDRLPAEPAAPVAVAKAEPPTKAEPSGPDPAGVKKLEDEVARLDAEAERLDGEIARRTPDPDRLAAARTDLDRVRRRLAELDRPAADPVPPPRPDVDPAIEAEVKALRAKKAQLGERLGPEHRDMVALDEQIRAAERRAAAARPKPPEPAPGPSRAEVEAERSALVAQAALLSGAVARGEAAGAELEKLRGERERVANARVDASAKLVEAKAPPRPAPAAAGPEPAPAAVAAKPPVWRSVVPGGLAGLLAGAGLGYLLALVAPVAAYREPRPPAPPRPARPPKPAKKGPPDEAEAFGMPVLARVPAIRTDQPPEKRSGEGWDPALAAFHRPSSAEAEAFRAARRALTAALQNRGHQVVLLTSPGPGDGKTTVAANLAVSLAQAGKRVILVDCDLRSPGVQPLFQLGRHGDGLRSVMTADVDLRLAVRSCEVGNLFLLPAGRGEMDPVDLLTRPKFRELVAELRGRYEYVLVDGPPATADKELAALAEYADGAVVAVRAGADAADRAGWAAGQLAAAGVKVLGAVVNAAPATAADAGRGREPPATVRRPSGTPNS